MARKENGRIWSAHEELPVAVADQRRSRIIMLSIVVQPLRLFFACRSSYGASTTTALAGSRVYVAFRVWSSRSGARSGRREEGGAGGVASSYTTLAAPCGVTLEVKKSKFIAVAAPVDDEAAALSFLSQVRNSSASHNCWAFKIGDRTRFSDDGEPGGTAGRPMLTAITASGIDHVMVVVTRFFGGTKLGTGGLVRAYGTVTSDCLKGAETIIVKAKVFLKIWAPYDVLGVLYPLLQKYDVQKLDEVFDSEGEGGVTMDLMIDTENLTLLERDLELTTKGRASVSNVERFVYIRCTYST